MQTKIVLKDGEDYSDKLKKKPYRFKYAKTDPSNVLTYEVFLAQEDLFLKFLTFETRILSNRDQKNSQNRNFCDEVKLEYCEYDENFIYLCKRAKSLEDYSRSISLTDKIFPFKIEDWNQNQGPVYVGDFTKIKKIKIDAHNGESTMQFFEKIDLQNVHLSTLEILNELKLKNDIVPEIRETFHTDDKLFFMYEGVDFLWDESKKKSQKIETLQERISIYIGMINVLLRLHKLNFVHGNINWKVFVSKNSKIDFRLIDFSYLQKNSFPITRKNLPVYIPTKAFKRGYADFHDDIFGIFVTILKLELTHFLGSMEFKKEEVSILNSLNEFLSFDVQKKEDLSEKSSNRIKMLKQSIEILSRSMSGSEKEEFISERNNLMKLFEKVLIEEKTNHETLNDLFLNLIGIYTSKCNSNKTEDKSNCLEDYEEFIEEFEKSRQQQKSKLEILKLKEQMILENIKNMVSDNRSQKRGLVLI